MIPVEELRKENDEIKDISEIISILVSHPTLHSNAIFCELLKRFQRKLDDHLMHEARSIYPELLSHDDDNIKQVAKDFVSNTHELERILKKYTKRWCKDVDKESHADFENETKELFRLIDERIQLEETHLFPVL